MKRLILLLGIVILSGNAFATCSEEDLYKALKLARKYINDQIITTEFVYRTPAQSLRHQADLEEQKEMDILFIDKVLKCKPEEIK